MPEKKFDFDPALMDKAFAEAMADAKLNSIPIGSSLLFDDGKQREVYSGRNRRVQDNSAIRHAEMDCLESIGSKPPEWFKHTTLFTTLFPCTMCSGAVALFGIPRVVIGEATNFPDAASLQKGRAFLEMYGVEYQIIDDARCIDALAKFIKAHPDVWGEDVPYQY